MDSFYLNSNSFLKNKIQIPFVLNITHKRGNNVKCKLNYIKSLTSHRDICDGSCIEGVNVNFKRVIPLCQYVSIYSVRVKVEEIEKTIKDIIKIINNYKLCTDCDQIVTKLDKEERCLTCHLQNKINSELPSDGECPICLSPVNINNSKKLNCKHPLHKKCFNKMCRKFCPLCREDIK